MSLIAGSCTAAMMALANGDFFSTSMGTEGYLSSRFLLAANYPRKVNADVIRKKWRVAIIAANAAVRSVANCGGIIVLPQTVLQSARYSTN